MKFNKVQQANINVHTELIVKGHYQSSVHKSERNKKKLKNYFKQFKKNNFIHLDSGCGDGFIFECIPKNFSSFGVDITEAMLAECKTKFPNVTLKKSVVENLPFENEFFDISTSFSFLDHLNNRNKYYLESFRTLKKDGIFFSGLIPNYYFYEAFLLKKLFNESLLPKDIIHNELQKAFYDGDHYLNKFNINKNELNLCEPGKSQELGINPYKEIKLLEEVGFKNIKIEFDWIVGENYINDKSLIKKIYKASDICCSAFKYFNIYARK